MKMGRWAVLIALAGIWLWGQTPTGTLQGLVTDSTGGVVPAATVRITNVQTNVKWRFTTASTGRYVAPLLPPGVYEVIVEAPGFRPAKQENIVLEVAQNRAVDFTLTVGSLTETIEVQATAPALATSTSYLGQVVEHRKIVDLPLNGRNVMSLVNLTPGVNDAGRGSTPRMGGSRSAVSESMIDGISVITPENNVGVNDGSYTPQVDSVQEFNVQVSTVSAEYGRLGGGIINLITKSGTNQLHGTVYWFHRDAALDANTWTANKAGRAKGKFKRTQFGGTVGGPVVIPRVYDGHDKTFFFFGYEGTSTPGWQVAQYNLAPAEWRNGDFFNNALGRIIYDPRTVRTDSGGVLVRDPFPGNKIPTDRFNPVAVKVLKYLPAPNVSNPSTFYRNFTAEGNTSREDNRFDARMDHNFTSAWRVQGRVSRAWGSFSDFNAFRNIASPTWGGPETSSALHASLDNTISINPTLVLNLRYGAGRRYVRRGGGFSQGFDVRELGYTGVYAQVFTQLNKQFPGFSFGDDHSGLGPSGWNTLMIAPLVHTFTGSATKISGSHTLKAGGEYRKLFLNFYQYGHPSGSYSFSRDWTRRTPTVFDATGGMGFASFLLGLYAGADTRHEPTTASSSSYMALYLQDDWKVTRKLTLNLGLRWDADIPRTERFDRYSYWTPALPSPIAGKVPANACLFCGDLRGQMLFVNDTGAYGRRQVPTEWNNFSPRVGFAYQVAPRTVLRGGFGVYYMPSGFQASGTSGGSGMAGFDSTSTGVNSYDNMVTVNGTLDNPYPEGFNLPLGRAGGAATDLGWALNSTAYFDCYRVPYALQWNLNVQRELPGSITVEVGYLANKGLFLIDGDGARVYSQNHPIFMQLKNELYTMVPNPFYGVLTRGSTLIRPTIQYRYLLRPYPQYDGVQAFRKPGANSIFHGMTLSVNKRFSKGLSFLLAFTGGKVMDDSASAVGFLGATGGARMDHYNRRLDWSVSPQDVSRKLVFSFVYDLPFGTGSSYLVGLPKVVNTLVSGWQTNGIVTWQTGQPLQVAGASNQTGLLNSGQRAVSTGKSARLDNRSMEKYLDTTVFVQPAAFQFGNVGRMLPDVRGPNRFYADLSLFKNNYFGRDRKYNVQFRSEWFNAFNHPNWGSPNMNMTSPEFGMITSKSDSRQIQMAVKFIF